VSAPFIRQTNLVLPMQKYPFVCAYKNETMKTDKLKIRWKINGV